MLVSQLSSDGAATIVWVHSELRSACVPAAGYSTRTADMQCAPHANATVGVVDMGVNDQRVRDFLRHMEQACKQRGWTVAA